jgi:Ca2+-binding RTX toxin-like protein
MTAVVSPGDVTASQLGDDLVLKILDTGDQLTVSGYFSGAAVSVNFVDGTTWNVETIKDNVLTGTGAAGRLLGFSDRSDVIRGSAGNEVEFGLSGDDVLSGGGGQDALYGGAGNDTYQFGVGSGNSMAFDREGSANTIQISAGVLPSDVRVMQSGYDLLLTVNNTSDRFRVRYFFADPSAQVSQLSFSDGTVWNGATLQTLARGIVAGTDGPDTLLGTAGHDLIVGLDGNDLLDGATGADTLEGGRGDDIYLVDNAGDMTIEALNEGTDTVLSTVAYTLGSNVENLTLTGIAAANGTGNELDNVLTGNSGANVLTGSWGNDTYIIGVGDTVLEQMGEGVDTVQTEMSYTLGLDIENLTLMGTGSVNATGNDLDNVLIGNIGTNILTGGAGNDTYVIGAGDSVLELPGEGTDSVQADFSYILGANVENLTLTGNADINGTGNELDNVLIGNSGENIMIGAAGNDTYVIGAGDTIMELPGEGTDTVQTDTSYALGTNVENLTLTGNANINATGNNLDNLLIGNSGNNILDGATGADTMSGADGDDTYIVDNAGDAAVEFPGTGIDTVQSAISYLLPGNVENLILTGNAAIEGTGNELDNVLTGNSGANVLSGGLGDDTYIIGASDTVAEMSGEGVDTVQTGMSYALGANVENLTLTGTANIDGTGNDLNNVFIGNSANNVMAGGAGNDTYLFNRGSEQDTIVDVDATAGNTDIIQMADDVAPADILVTRTGDDLVLQLAGTSDQTTIKSFFVGPQYQVEQVFFSDWTVWGVPALMDHLPKTLTGTSNSDILYGGAGPDSFDGAGGNDRLRGFGGNDTYIFGVGAGQDLVMDFDQTPSNIDTIQMMAGVAPSSLTVTRADADLVLSINGTTDQLTVQSFFTNPDYQVERLQFADGTTWDSTELGDMTLQRGGPYPDVLIGPTINYNDLLEGGGTRKGDNSVQYPGNDKLLGSPGDDWLYGLEGMDYLDGGPGDDFLQGDGDPSGQFARRVLINDNDTLLGGEGNDQLYGAGGDDYLDGGAGDDVLDGDGGRGYTDFDGNLVGPPNPGNDTLLGGDGNDLLYGDSGDDVLDGGPGNDMLISGTGSDTYVFGRGYGQDVIQEEQIGLAKQDFNTIRMASDILPGDVTVSREVNPHAPLEGKLDLVLKINGTDDQIAVQGFFQPTFSTFSQYQIDEVEFADGTVWDVEALKAQAGFTIYGTPGADILKAYDLRDVLAGLGGDDTLDDNGFAKTMAGGLGNDTYLVSSERADVLEAAGQGVDNVLSSVNYTLPENIENLRLDSSAGTNPEMAIIGVGNALDNVLTGNSADNILEGGDGNDTLDGGAQQRFRDPDRHFIFTPSGNDILIGGAGSDTYLYTGGVDTIIDDSASGNVLRLGAYSLSAEAGVLVVHQAPVTGSTETNAIRITTFDPNDAYGPHAIDTYTFADGTSLTYRQFIDRGFDTNGTTGNDFITGTNVVDRISGLGGNDQIFSGAGDDVLYGGLGDDWLNGEDGNDTLYGNEGADSMWGQAGDDVLYGGLGDDWVNGLEGNDTLNGDEGNDSIFGGIGNDIVNGGAGDDWLNGDDGNDTLYGNDGVDSMFGQAGDDVFYGGLGDDWVNGLEGNDTLNGDEGDDSIYGGSGNDILSGGLGDDWVEGEDGNDTLSGGAGDDTLIGGAGNDTYIFNRGDGVDTIYDVSAPGEGNVIQFGAGITAANLTVTEDQAARSLTIVYDSTGDTVQLAGFDPANVNGSLVVNTLQFSDGSVVNLADILSPVEMNHAPTVENLIADQTRVEEIAFTFQVPANTFADPDAGDLLAYSASLATGAVLPAWLGFDAATQKFSGTPDDAQVGTLSLKVTATDSGSLSAASTFALTVTNVNEAPTVANAIADQNTLEDAGFSFQMPANTFADPDVGDTLTYNATLSDNSPLPSWLAFDGASQKFIGTPDDAQVGTVSLKVTATDTGSLSTSGNFNLTITNVNEAPALANAMADQMTAEDGPFSLVAPVNTFVDPDAGDTLTYSAKLAGGAALPAWLSFDGTSRTLSGTPDNGDVGNVSIMLTAADTAGLSVTDTFALTVTNVNDVPTVAHAIADQNTLQDAAFSFQMPANTFADVDAGDVLTYGAMQASGAALPAWLTFDTTTHSFSGTPHAGDVGTISLKVTATDSGNLSATDVFGFTVTTVPNPVITGTPGNDTLIGTSGDDVIQGLGGKDTLRGLAGNDLLDGGVGADVLVGGAGDDTYVVDHAGDVVTENAGEGTDTVQSSVTYTLGPNVENLTLTGSSAINGTGNALNNILTGNSGKNVLKGGAGNDTYIVGSLDSVVENANEGTDTVLSYVTFTLDANVENLTLGGSIALDGTGNALANVLTGNSAANVLDGGAGADALVGGVGDDTYVVDHAGDVVTENAGEGTDTVQSSITYTLGANVENLTLTGKATINGTGNALDNVLTGNAKANELTGGAGNDTYVVGAGDTVIENANEGTDTVQSAVTWTLGANVENLTLTGNAKINGTGNSLNNLLSGNSGNNILTGGAGNDTYLYDRGGSKDTIVDNDATVGNSDKLQFGTAVNPIDLILSRQANNLKIAIYGSSDQVTIQDWYKGAANQTETIQAGDGSQLVNTKVDQLIQAMATYTAGSGLSWDQALTQKPEDVKTILAANWH